MKPMDKKRYTNKTLESGIRKAITRSGEIVEIIYPVKVNKSSMAEMLAILPSKRTFWVSSTGRYWGQGKKKKDLFIIAD